jgi:hypothetical protein
MAVNNWSGWAPVQNGRAAPNSPVTAVENDRFVTGSDGRIYTTSWDGAAYRPWAPVSDGQARPESPIAAVYPLWNPNECDANHVHLFVVRADGRICTAVRDDNHNWSPWSPVGDVTALPGTEVGAVSRIPETIDLAITASNGRIMVNPWLGGAAGWSNPSGGGTNPGTKVAATRHEAKEQAYLFVTDGAGNIDAMSRDVNPWGNWIGVQPGQVHPGAPVTAVSISRSRMDLFVTDPQGNVAWIYTEDRGWAGGWQHLGTTTENPSAPITVVSRKSDEMTVLTPGINGVIHAIDSKKDNDWELGWSQVPNQPHVKVGAQNRIGAVARDAQTIEVIITDDEGNIQTGTFTH